MRCVSAGDCAAAGQGALITLVGAYGMGKTRVAAALARDVHGAGATVLYASGAEPSEAALATLARATDARRPTLVVLDDADRAPLEVRQALRELGAGERPVLTIATGLQAAALARLEPREALQLEPLDAEAVAAIAELYAPPGSEIPAAELLRASRGAPRRVHEAASEWARRSATERVDTLAGRTAARRSQTRALESELTGSVIDLQSTLERIDERPATSAVICPYKGLASFEADDADFFFGREGLVAELVAHLVGARLLALVGPSGSGKSSVLRAGLLPALAGGVLPGSQHWPQIVIRPGPHPARELRRYTFDRRGVLAVDQFEELFTACQDERQRAEFVSALLERPAGRGRRARGLLRPLRGLPGAVACARGQPRARRADEPRRAAASDRAAGAASRPGRRAGADRRVAGGRGGRAGGSAAALDDAARALGPTRRAAVAARVVRASRRRPGRRRAAG